MRSARVLGFAILLFAICPSTSGLGHDVEPQNVTWELPPVQWSIDLESGYVSTSPLVIDDLLIVKVGGSSENTGGEWVDGRGPGIYAFNTYSGEQIWRYEHNQSRSGFEISPPVYVEHYEMLINGWTSGNITAHNIETGELLWSHETERISWGITGKPLSIIGDQFYHDSIHLATETGVIGLTPNGTVMFEHSFPDNATGYRNGLGLILLDYNFSLPFTSQNGMFLATGDEKGGIHAWKADGGDFTSWDLDDLLGFSGWKVRTPPFITSLLDEPDSFGLGIVVQGQNGGEFLTLDYQENGSLELNAMVSLGIAPAIPLLLPAGVVVTGDLSSVLAHCSFNSSGCDNATLVDSGPVSGEITSLFGEYNSGGMPFAIPHNTEEGYWTGHLIWWNETKLGTSLQWDWHPEKPGWITAGVGGTSEVMAAANDASWLEVRFENTSTLENNSTEIENDNSSYVSNSTVTGLSMVNELFLVVILMVSMGALFTGTSNAKRAGSIGILLVLLLLLPTLNVAWVSSVSNEGGDKLVDSRQFPSEYANTQVVCFEFPDDVWDEDSGLSLFLNENGEEIGRSLGNQSRTCVGGLQGHQNIHTVSIEATTVAGYNYTWDEQPLGLFVKDIGPGIAGDGDRWWLYWVDGKHGALAADLQPITNASVIEWRFL